MHYMEWRGGLENRAARFGEQTRATATPAPVQQIGANERTTPDRLLRPDETVLKAVDGNSDVPEWVQDRYKQFHRLLTNSAHEFPCYFAAVAEAAQALQFTYVKQSEVESPSALANALRRFLGEHSILRRPRTALITFVEDDCAAVHTLASEEARFWGILQSLHGLDSKPWPVHLPTEPDNPRWTFCFDGTPLFIAGHSPSYENRLSRKAEGGMFLVIQPRSNLEGITGLGAKAEKVRQRIRRLLVPYDRVSPSPELGIYGDTDSREWRQYWLLDSNEPAARACPLVIRDPDDAEKPTR